MQQVEKIAAKRKTYDDNHKEKSEYDIILLEAITLGKQHQTKAKYYVPKMYQLLTIIEGLSTVNAAERIYKDLDSAWQKDTIRRLLPPEVKNQVARERQALSRQSLVNKAGSILRKTASEDNNLIVINKLDNENIRLRRELEELKILRHSQMERILQLEKKIEMLQHTRGVRKEASSKMIIVPPHLFMKVFTLMRSSAKPLALKVEGNEVIDIDKIV